MDNSQERFYQMVTRLKSRAAAAASTQDDVRITEMVNGVLITRPAKKYQEIGANPITTTKEPIIIDLQQDVKSKAGSVFVQENKMKVINDFINRGY